MAAIYSCLQSYLYIYSKCQCSFSLRSYLPSWWYWSDRQEKIKGSFCYLHVRTARVIALKWKTIPDTDLWKNLLVMFCCLNCKGCTCWCGQPKPLGSGPSSIFIYSHVFPTLFLYAPPLTELLTSSASWLWAYAPDLCYSSTSCLFMTYSLDEFVTSSTEPPSFPPLMSTPLILNWQVTFEALTHTQSSYLEYFGDAFIYIDFSLLDWDPEKQKCWLIHLCLSFESLFHNLRRWWPWKISESLWSSVSSSVKVGDDGHSIAEWLRGLNNIMFIKHST